MKINHILFKGLLPSLLIGLSANAHSCTGWGRIQADWGQAYFSSSDGSTISGYTQDDALGNGNCVKLKQGQYAQIDNTRTCTYGAHNFSGSAMPNPGAFGSIYLYEENSNRTANIGWGGWSC